MTVQATVLYSFNSTDGYTSAGPVALDAAGDVFVATDDGGAGSSGSVVEISANSGAVTVLGNFTTDTGYGSYTGVTSDVQGDLFGVTEGGDVFEIPYANGAYGSLTVLAATGYDEPTTPVVDSNGNLFFDDGGVIFEVAKNAGGGYASTATVLADVPSGDGYPQAGLTVDAQGDIFGTAYSSGNDGTVFELAAPTGSSTTYSSTPTVIASFDGADGIDPQTPLLVDSSGNLFGAALTSSSSGNSVIYEVANTGNGAYASTPTDLATTPGGVLGTLAMDANGDIFGVTDQGSVFEILHSKTGYAPETLLNLDSSSAVGYAPYAGLSIDANGDLFGTTNAGGANGNGTIFEIAAAQIDPTITCVVASQLTKSDAPVTPFSGVTVSDPTDADAGAGTDVLTITQTGTGTLSGTGLTATATAGVYTLSGTAASITSELDALSFQPATGSSSTTSFALSYQSSLYASAVTAATSVEDLDAPTVSDASVMNGVVTAADDTATQALTGTALAGSTVDIYLNGATTPTYQATAGANGDWSQTIGVLSPGSYSYTATATDASGNVSAASSALDFVVAPPPSPPSVSITSPAGGLVHQSQTIDVSASVAAGDTVTGVEIYDGSTPLGAATQNANGTWSANVTLPVGVDAITATATDAYNNVGTSASVDYLAAPDADALITAKPWSLVTFANNPTAVDATAGHVAVVGGAGSDLVFGGSYDAIGLGNGADTVIGGSNEAIGLGGGNDTISVGSNALIAAGNGNDAVTAGGDSVIGLGNGNDTVNAGADSSTTVGTGHNLLVAAAGDSWNLAANGYDTFQIDPGFGDNAISGFNTSHDVLEFSTALFANFSAVMDDAKQVGANTVITYDKNDVVTLDNVTASHLTAADFKFV